VTDTPKDSFELPLRGAANRRNVTAWLTLGLISLAAAGMGLMGLGGLISVVGGLLFLIVAYQSMSRRQTQ